MGYLSSLSLDRLVREEGSEYANAFTLLGAYSYTTGTPPDT